MTSFDRRSALRLGALGAGGALLAAYGDAEGSEGRASGFVLPDGPQVRAVEEARGKGPLRDLRLVPSEGLVDLGGRTVHTWSFGERLPGAQIRVKAGEVVRVRVTNRLPTGTTVHWHGLALRNAADGVPGVTQAPIEPGADYEYRFTVPHPGTYFYHSHMGVQADRGLYGPFIVDDPHEPLHYDAEWTVVLDDWLDGVNGTPDEVLAELRHGMPPMAGMGMGGQTPGSAPKMGPHLLPNAGSDLLAGDAGDVRYPYFLINGRIASAPRTFHAKPGDRVRIRFINAGGDTPFRVALGGHRMTVTHTDGYPVNPVLTDALLIGMGERYDALVTVKDGAFPLTALAEGKHASALAVLRTSPHAATPTARDRPAELQGKIVRYVEMRPADRVRLPRRGLDRTIRLELTGTMAKYDWAINNRPYDPDDPYPVRSGERVRVSFVNRTTMWHPMHLHGHTFALTKTGLRKDTANVRPGGTMDIDFDADNPGRWMLHCHNVYHGESGMMTVLSYQK
ncbi:multicopper oxidase family protein [Spirillospora sp. NPDC052269]